MYHVAWKAMEGDTAKKAHGVGCGKLQQNGVRVFKRGGVDATSRPTDKGEWVSVYGQLEVSEHGVLENPM